MLRDGSVPSRVSVSVTVKSRASPKWNAAIITSDSSSMICQGVTAEQGYDSAQPARLIFYGTLAWFLTDNPDGVSYISCTACVCSVLVHSLTPYWLR